jgi:hypothetical protein
MHARCLLSGGDAERQGLLDELGTLEELRELHGQRGRGANEDHLAVQRTWLAALCLQGRPLLLQDVFLDLLGRLLQHLLDVLRPHLAESHLLVGEHYLAVLLAELGVHGDLAVCHLDQAMVHPDVSLVALRIIC